MILHNFQLRVEDSNPPLIELVAMALKSADMLVFFQGSITVLVLYLLSLAVRRLFLTPLAKFPGPKLAALTNWYEFYYDVVQQGKFTAHIQQLHRQYGRYIIPLGPCHSNPL